MSKQALVKRIVNLNYLSLFITSAILCAGCSPAPNDYGLPERTNWKPEGPRILPNAPEITGSPAT